MVANLPLRLRLLRAKPSSRPSSKRISPLKIQPLNVRSKLRISSRRLCSHLRTSQHIRLLWQGSSDQDQSYQRWPSPQPTFRMLLPNNNQCLSSKSSYMKALRKFRLSLQVTKGLRSQQRALNLASTVRCLNRPQKLLSKLCLCAVVEDWISSFSKVRTVSTKCFILKRAARILSLRLQTLSKCKLLLKCHFSRLKRPSIKPALSPRHRDRK